MSSLPTFAKTWDFSKINTRITYVSLNDLSASLMFGIKSQCVATAGATVWGSCDGTTGDNTDRWASKANCTTQGAATTNANSWCVFAWGSGQFMMSFVGATADVFRVSYSPGSLFVLAGTPNQTPTATDECIIAAAITMVGATTSSDRVYNVLTTSDRSVLRVSCYRQGSIQRAFGFEKVTEAPAIPTGTMIGWNAAVGTATALNVAGAHGGIFTAGTTGATNVSCIYINGAARSWIGGTVVFNAATSSAGGVFFTPTELNGGVPVFPLFVGSVTASNTGWIGTRIDAFYATGLLPIEGNTIDDITAGTRIIWLGTMLHPWSTTVGLVTS